MPSLEEQLGLGRLGLRSAPRLRSFFDEQQDQPEPPAQPDITTQPRKFTLEEPETDDFRAALADRLKTLPPEDVENNPHGALQYALDILDLPRNVVANLINTVVQAEPASKERAFGLRRVGTSDILRKIGLSAGDSLGTPGKVADAVVGFIGDVATDPLTYLTLGTSGLAGSAARRIGGQTLKHAAAPKVAQLAEDLIASGKVAAESLPDAQKAIAQAGTKVGSAYGEQAVRTAAEKQAAEQIAREAPELVDKNVLGLTTRGLKEFRPGALPYSLGTIIPRTIAPEAVSKLDDLVEKIPDAIRRPFGFLPEKDISLVTTDTAKAISDKLGLGKLGEQIAASPIGRKAAPYVAAARNAVDQAGDLARRSLQPLFSNEPLPKIPGDAADEVRYEAQKLEQFQREYVAQQLREIAQTEPKKIRAMIAGVMEETGLPEPAVNQAAIELIERLPSSYESLDNIAIQIKRIAGEAKGTDAQAEQLAKFVPDTPEQIAARAAAEEQRKQWTQAPGQLAPEPPPLPAGPTLADFAPRQGAQAARDYTPIDQLVKQVLLEARGEKLSDGTLKRRVFAIMPGTAMDGRATQSDWLNATGHPIGTNRATEIIAESRKRVGYEVRQSVHDQAKAELAAFERDHFAGLSKKDIAAAKRGPQYKALKARVTSYLARASTEHTAEEIRAATERARSGDIDDMTLIFAPVDELPRPVADLIKADADNQLEFLRKFQHKYPGRITALAKIARGAGEDTGAAVIAEKERIIRRLRGAMDDSDFTPEMRTWGIPGPPEDPLFRLVGENDAAKRAAIVADALRATEEGEPSDLVNAAYKYLGQGLKREPTQDETLDFLAQWGGGKAAEEGTQAQGHVGTQTAAGTPQVSPVTPQEPPKRRTDVDKWAYEQARDAAREKLIADQRSQIESELLRHGFKLGDQSDSGSKYFDFVTPDNKLVRVRVSDHDIPITEERQSNWGQGRKPFTHDIRVNAEEHGLSDLWATLEEIFPERSQEFDENWQQAQPAKAAWSDLLFKTGHDAGKEAEAARRQKNPPGGHTTESPTKAGQFAGSDSGTGSVSDRVATDSPTIPAQENYARNSLPGPQLTIDLPPNRPGRPGTLTVQDDMQRLINYAEQRSKARIAEAEANNIAAPELSTKRELGYFTRLMLGDAKDNLFALIRKGGMGLRSRFQNVREAWRERTTMEANREIARLNATLADPNYAGDLSKLANGDPETLRIAEEMKLQPGQQLPAYNEDVALAHTYRELEHARTIGSADFFETLAKSFGKQVERGGPIPDGYSHATAGKFSGILGDYVFTDPVRKIIDKHVLSLEDPAPMLRAWRAVQGSWKGFALMAPGYHVANMFGNVWNSRLLDAWSERAFNDARRVQKAMVSAKGAPSLGTQLQGTGLTYEDFYREMVRRGVVGSGFYGAEGPGTADNLREILETIDKPATIAQALADVKAGKIITANQTIGKIGEEASRLSFIIERMRKGDTIDDAAAKMKAALFDYRDLTSFEAGTSTTAGIRDAIPFYAWTKNNSKLLYWMAVTNPAKLATVPKLQLSLESAFAGDETLPPSMRPPHILEEGGAQVSGGASPRYLNLGRMLPVGEFKYNPLRPGQAITNMVENVAGPFKTAYELATNRDQFFDRDIVEYPGQRKEFLGANIDPRLKHVARTIRPLNLMEQVRTGIGTAPDIATGAATAAAQLGGVRVFGVEASRQVYEAEKTFNDQLGAVRRDMKRRLQSIAEAGGDPAGDGELARLAGIHEQIKAQRDALPRAEARAISRPLSQRRRQMLDEYMQAYRTPAAQPAGV